VDHLFALLSYDSSRPKPVIPPAWQGEPADQGHQFGLDPIQLADPLDAVLGNRCGSLRMISTILRHAASGRKGSPALRQEPPQAAPR
jgi:hypothetical protein